MKKSCNMSQLDLSENVATNNVNNNKVINMVTLEENDQSRSNHEEKMLRVLCKITDCVMQKLQFFLFK
jgi:hypothetical protein